MTNEQMIAWLRSYSKFAVYLLDKERINAIVDRIEALREALAEQVEACFCPDCEMCFRHEQLLKETER